ncbi:zinc ABC transporter substrate-binding protein [Shimia sagamensis]|uniref:High-affinity zinc uptake system protein ZnuA n=1 Tax=Shimia sagamensis TaxID=1566352 RepID=A0ABY1N6F4_9RHOB|nr:zinc ABC transporter substrate-binding protein [Shimia sagamensis]SMP01678.1 zinc transport system substrate-binding protein [Shimia sagamensis]
MRIISTAIAASFVALSAQADVPKVVTDIAPIQALVAKVMEGVGTSKQLLPANVSPHDYAMRPSEARALQNADLVIWVGAELTPTLEDSIESLAGKAQALELLHLNGTRELEFRESETFIEMSLGGEDAHDHGGHDEDHHDDHDKHDDHDDHEEHGEHEAHAENEDDHEGHAAEDEHHDEHDTHASHDGHSHEGVDPHAWLDPENARFWANAIALKLSELDPDNAAAYRANAADLDAELAALTMSISEQLTPLSGRGFVVFHDAYQYFETRFDLAASGAFLNGDGASPSAARLKAIQVALKENNITCVFTEPQFNHDIVAAISDGLDLHSEELDPTGAKQNAPNYPDLIQTLANQFEACLSH